MKLIYPDTIIWNLLCDQNVDPVTFLQQLNAKGYTLALSFHTVYELGRNFETDDPSRIARGKQLFSYVKQYLDLGIPCTKELWELIVAKGRNQFGGEESLTDLGKDLARSNVPIPLQPWMKNSDDPLARRTFSSILKMIGVNESVSRTKAEKLAFDIGQSYMPDRTMTPAERVRHELRKRIIDEGERGNWKPCMTRARRARSTPKRPGKFAMTCSYDPLRPG